jgi:hypothetical protein
MRLMLSQNRFPQYHLGFDLFVRDQISMDSAHLSNENSFELEINPNKVYNRAWMILNLPGMHKNRIQQLESKFDLLPLNSGNREAFYIYRGLSILEALEKEAYARRGVSEENEDE